MICQKVEALFLKILHQKNNIRDIVTKMKLDYLATIAIKPCRNKILFVFKKTFQ